MHYIISIHQIKRELQFYGYTVLHVSNIISKRTTQASSMFSIELQSAKNNTGIFNMPWLVHTIIQIELLCHTSNYWNKGYKRIKCAKQQLYKNCVNRLDKLTCSNCKEAHPTNRRDYKLREELIAEITRQRPKTWPQKETNNSYTPNRKATNSSHTINYPVISFNKLYMDITKIQRLNKTKIWITISMHWLRNCSTKYPYLWNKQYVVELLIEPG